MASSRAIAVLGIPGLTQGSSLPFTLWTLSPPDMGVADWFIQSLIHRLDGIVMSSYIIVASAAIVYYDYLLTLGKEDRGCSEPAIYSHQGTILPFPVPGNYYNLLVNIWNIEYCRISLVVVDVLCTIYQTSIALSMGLKTVAIWNGRRIIVYSVWIFFGTIVVLGYTVSAYATIKLHNAVYYLPSANLCLVDHTPQIAWVIPVLQLTFDAYVTGLLCYMAYRQYLNMPSLGPVPIIRILLFNGLVYFFLIDSLKLVTAVVWAYINVTPVVYAPLHLDVALSSSLRRKLHPPDDTTSTKMVFNDDYSRPTTALQPFGINGCVNGHDDQERNNNDHGPYWEEVDDFGRPSDVSSFYERHHRRSSSHNSNYLQIPQQQPRRSITDSMNATSTLPTPPTLHTIHSIRDIREIQGIREIQEAQIKEVQEMYGQERGRGQRDDYIPMTHMPTTPESARTTSSQPYR